jgi:hypothetical protein
MQDVEREKLDWDVDGMCDDHGAFVCPKCAMTPCTATSHGIPLRKFEAINYIKDEHDLEAYAEECREQGWNAAIEAAAEACENRGVTLSLDGMANGTACGIRIAATISQLKKDTGNLDKNEEDR